MRNRPIFITGISTGVGKTIVSAILVERLKADYWKPVQSRDLENSDTALVKSLVSNTSPGSILKPIVLHSLSHPINQRHWMDCILSLHNLYCRKRIIS